MTDNWEGNISVIVAAAAPFVVGYLNRGQRRIYTTDSSTTVLVRTLHIVCIARLPDTPRDRSYS